MNRKQSTNVRTEIQHFDLLAVVLCIYTSFLLLSVTLLPLCMHYYALFNPQATVDIYTSGVLLLGRNLHHFRVQHAKCNLHFKSCDAVDVKRR